MRFGPAGFGCIWVFLPGAEALLTFSQAFPLRRLKLAARCSPPLTRGAFLRR